jgi:SPP1 family predicted phage head-tail adaptor
MIDPGQLKTRLAVQQPVEVADGQGGVSRTWTTFANVWGQVSPVGASASIEADAAGATQRYRIILRSQLSLTTQHRFVEGARIYRIVGLRESNDRRFVEIDAEVRIG